MKGNKELTKDKYFNKLSESNSDKYIQLSSYKIKIKLEIFIKILIKKIQQILLKKKKL